jgi:hypothetical protein
VIHIMQYNIPETKAKRKKSEIHMHHNDIEKLQHRYLFSIHVWVKMRIENIIFTF